MSLVFYKATGKINDKFGVLGPHIQLIGDKTIENFSQSSVYKNSKIFLDEILDNMESKYLISNYDYLDSVEVAKEIISEIKKINDNKKDCFFLASVNKKSQENYLLCYQDIKKYRGKTSGPILHIKRSELGENISASFYRYFYKEWKFMAQNNRYQSFWKDVEEIILNYNLVHKSNQNN